MPGSLEAEDEQSLDDIHNSCSIYQLITERQYVQIPCYNLPTGRAHV